MVISVTITAVKTNVRTRVESRFSQWPNREKMIVTIGKTPSQVTMTIL